MIQRKKGAGTKRPVDLKRERQLRKIDSDVKRALAGDAEKVRRLKAHLAGELPAMKQDRSVTVRLPGALVERIEALVPAVATDLTVLASRGGGGGVGLSAVVRLALLEGLTVIEERHGQSR